MPMQGSPTTIDRIVRREFFAAEGAFIFNNNNRKGGSDEHLHHASPLPPFAPRNSSEVTSGDVLQRFSVVLPGDVLESTATRLPSLSTTVAPSPKNSHSLGYDDDALSPFSTPTQETAPLLLGHKKPRTPLERSSTVLSLPVDDNDAAEVTELTGFTAGHHSLADCREILRADGQQRCVVDAEEHAWQLAGQGGESEVVAQGRGPRTGGVGAVTDALQKFCLGNNSSCGISTMTAVLGDEGAAFAAGHRVVMDEEREEEETGEEEEDSEVVVSHCYDDDVLGVTAEGEFIYRRDIEAEEELRRWANYQQQQHDSRGMMGADVRSSNTICPDDTVKQAADALPRTPEECLPPTTLHDTAGVAPACRGPFARRSAAPAGRRKNAAWTPSDVERCSLLLRYHLRENAEAAEYRLLVGVVDGWRDEWRRFPAEALERRLREGDNFDRPPFIIRW